MQEINDQLEGLWLQKILESMFAVIDYIILGIGAIFLKGIEEQF